MKLYRKMTTTKAFYDNVLNHARNNFSDIHRNINIRHIFKNYRNNKGLNLTRFGLLVFQDMGIESESFILDKDITFTAHLRILLDRYNKYPYYIDRSRLILFGEEDRILFKLYGKDLDAWVEHMEQNLE